VKEFAVYTAARLGLFLLAYALVIGIYLLVSGERDQIPLIWPFLVAVVISGVASVYLLRPQRERFAQAVHRRAQRASTRVAQARAEEEARAEEQTAAVDGTSAAEPATAAEAPATEDEQARARKDEPGS
jgi:hypothetical protein